ncbi:hypothetical protein RQP53_14080 [Paucibacter sp. APW11]|uniref:Uncharacterized protein n=1 Tax=Roseateles aquae TaxID=3077235 RepID=A0ABU3PCT7_9BURK|nr:hypothetical protein [Paucibacter sp. APW11]MDT9000399.1 hypothetical protein [Paucibacter sp. APW11]
MPPLPPLPASTGHADWQRPALRVWASETAAQLRQHEALHEAGAYALSPLMLPRQQMQGMQGQVHQLLQLARRLSLQLDAEGRWCRADQRSLVLAARERGPALAPIARPDGILVEGQLKLLELNLDSGLGWYFELEFAQQRAAQLNTMAWGGRHRVPRLWPAICNYVAQLMACRDKRRCRLVVLIDAQLGDYDRRHAQLFANRLNASLPGLNASVRCTEELHCSGTSLRDRAGPVDIVWRFASLAHEAARTASTLALLQRALRCDCLLASDPSDLGVESKLALAALSELAEHESPLLSTDERQLVNALVPWTRVLRPAEQDSTDGDLSTLALEQRRSLVLKRTHSRASLHVLIGCECSDAQWQQAIAKAKADTLPWVLQQNVSPTPLPFAFVGDSRSELLGYSVSPFVFGSAEAAPYVRIERNAEQRRLAVGDARLNGICATLLVDEPASIAHLAQPPAAAEHV